MELFVDLSYFGDAPLPLIIDGNEDAINKSIATYQPRYLRAVLGETLYRAFVLGITDEVTGVRFSNQFSNQFYKGVTADRWSYIRDGASFWACGRNYFWPGLKNAEKQSPLANYIWWYHLDSVNPRVTGVGGFSNPALENASVASPDKSMMRAWNDMVDWNGALYKLLVHGINENGTMLYPEFNLCELTANESINVYNHQIHA